MKTALYLVVVIAALTYAEKELEETHAIEAANTDEAKQSTFVNTPPAVGGGLQGDIQQAVAGDLNLKLVVEEDETPKGKCYCSCNLNDQLAFMEMDRTHLVAKDALE